MTDVGVDVSERAIPSPRLEAAVFAALTSGLASLSDPDISPGATVEAWRQ